MRVVTIYRLCILALLMVSTAHARWTSVFRQRITPQDVKNATDNLIVFTKDGVHPFSQLMFSWNAMRPHKGHFSFYVQARHARNKKWGVWHHMSDWGAGVQRSYVSKSDGIAQFVHVRLESNKANLCDGFRIKIIAKNGASLSQLKAFTVTIANSHDFKPEHYGDHIEQLSSVYVHDVPKISQFALNHPDNSRICSPTSCTMLIQFLTGVEIDPLDFARRSYDRGLGAYGSWPFNMAHAYEKAGGRGWFFNTRLNSFTELHAQLSRGIPVVVSVRGKMINAPREYPNGHLLVVVGWDAKKKQVICHDPASESHISVEKRYSFKDFTRAWDLSWRLAYWAEPIQTNSDV